MVEKIIYNDVLLGIIIKASFNESGIHFFTPGDFSQQLAFMKHSEGKVIAPHIHHSVTREVHFTKEVLFIRRGKIRVDFFDNDKLYLKSRILETGDVILLSEGGHGFEMLEETEMIEVKQGPYAGDADKTKFETKISNIKFD